MPLGDDVDIGYIAQQTHGFVGADLAALAREAAIKALRRYLPEIDLEAEEIPPEILEKMEVQARDFRDALRDVGPSAMREILLEVPHTTWGDVGGLTEAKQDIREAVEYPLTRREQFESLGIEPPKGVLLYGPPGTGKTLIAKAVASESGANFVPVKGPQLLSKWVGESERAVREVFKKARQVAPSIIFFDELDALAPARGGGTESHVVESVLNQILTEIDGLEELRGVVVMGATNRPDMVDPALLRPGRFDRLVYIGEPGREDRERILAIHTRYIPLEDSTMGELIAMTEGFTENDLEDLVLAVGANRQVSVEDVREHCAAITPGEEEEGLNAPVRRKRLVDLFAQQKILLNDPARDRLIRKVATETEGFVGSDLEALAREAAMLAMREGAAVVKPSHFENAQEKVHATMNERLRQYYGKVQQHFKGGLPKDIQPPEYQ
jgi:transitional endoplasmic reticulum ATPase